MKLALLLTAACFISGVCGQVLSRRGEEPLEAQSSVEEGSPKGGKADDVKQTGLQILTCGQSSDYHEYMRECAVDYMKSMGLGVQAGQTGGQPQLAAGSQAGKGGQSGGQGQNPQGSQGGQSAGQGGQSGGQYMQKYAADYMKYMGQGGQSGGQSAGQGQSAQGGQGGQSAGQGGQSGGQYMQKYAADYMKYMGQGGQSGGQGQSAQEGQGGQSGGQDYSKYLKQGASADDQGSPMAKGFAKFTKSTSKYAAPYQKYMSTGDQGGSGNLSAGNMPKFASQYVDKSAKGFESYIGRPGNASQSNQTVAGRGGQPTRGAAQIDDHVSKWLIRDCRSMKDLKQWRDVLLTQIRTHVAEALQTCPEGKVRHDFAKGRAHLLAMAEAHLAMAEEEAGEEFVPAAPPRREEPSAEADSRRPAPADLWSAGPLDRVGLAAGPPTRQDLSEGAALSSSSSLQPLLVLFASVAAAGFGVALAGARLRGVRACQGEKSVSLLQP